MRRHHLLVTACTLFVVAFTLFGCGGEPTDVTADALDLIERGDTAADAEQLQEAIEYYSKAISTTTRTGVLAVAYSRRGSSYFFADNLPAAISDFTAAIEYDSSRPYFFGQRGQAYYANGQYAEALEDFEEALKDDPDSYFDIFGRGLANAALGNHGDALQDFSRCIDIDPEDPAPLYRRAKSYIELNEWELALGDLKQFLEAEPTGEAASAAISEASELVALIEDIVRESEATTNIPENEISEKCLWFARANIIRAEEFAAAAQLSDLMMDVISGEADLNDPTRFEEFVDALRDYRPTVERFVTQWSDLGSGEDTEEFWQRELRSESMKLDAIDLIVEGYDKLEEAKLVEGIDMLVEAGNDGMESDVILMQLAAECAEEFGAN